ncbi:hypothetical protein GJ496_011745 [Pomphorhynchus laevis]|nr:hypothetical protein GJ496_011745 [Pomphorhynchus laevis]
MANPDNNMNAGNNYSNNIEFNVGNGDYVQQNRERTTINAMDENLINQAVGNMNFMQAVNMINELLSDLTDNDREYVVYNLFNGRQNLDRLQRIHNNRFMMPNVRNNSIRANNMANSVARISPDRTVLFNGVISEIAPQSNLLVTIEAASDTATDNQFTDATEAAIDNSNVGRTGSAAVIHNAEQHLNTSNLVQLINQYNRHQSYQSLDQLRYIEIRNRLRQLERRLQRRITALSRNFRSMRTQFQNEISRFNQHHQADQH